MLISIAWSHNLLYFGRLNGEWHMILKWNDNNANPNQTAKKIKLNFVWRKRNKRESLWIMKMREIPNVCRRRWTLNWSWSWSWIISKSDCPKIWCLKCQNTTSLIQSIRIIYFWFVAPPKTSNRPKLTDALERSETDDIAARPNCLVCLSPIVLVFSSDLYDVCAHLISFQFIPVTDNIESDARNVARVDYERWKMMVKWDEHWTTIVWRFW